MPDSRPHTPTPTPQAGAAQPDALVVVLTDGVSLTSWADAGLLRREWALYDRVLARLPDLRIVLLTEGGAHDQELVRQLGPRAAVVSDAAHAARALAGFHRVVVKTHQFPAAESALDLHTRLGRAGLSTALLARGGFLWSQLTAWESGAGSPAAVDAGLRESCLCRAADLVVGITPQMAADLAWRHNIGDERLAIIPNHVLPEDEPPLDPRSPGVILTTGRLVPQKRVDRLIEAMGGLRDEHRAQATLSIVGSGPLEDALRRQAADLGVRTIFEPHLPHDELMQRLRRCAVYAQTSAFEGHPKTIIEAMAVAAPVVVCDTPGMRGIVRHAVTGLCVQPDPDSIRLALEGLLDDPDWGGTLGLGASAHARNQYALDPIVELELHAYERALANAQARAARAAA